MRCTPAQPLDLLPERQPGAPMLTAILTARGHPITVMLTDPWPRIAGAALEPLHAPWAMLPERQPTCIYGNSYIRTFVGSYMLTGKKKKPMVLASRSCCAEPRTSRTPIDEGLDQ
jgi:hypothetical protein